METPASPKEQNASLETAVFVFWKWVDFFFHVRYPTPGRFFLLKALGGTCPT